MLDIEIKVKDATQRRPYSKSCHVLSFWVAVTGSAAIKIIKSIFPRHFSLFVINLLKEILQQEFQLL